ncbi:HSF-type DNA-binding protein [Nitzschia inconspicua]|uniref:HSF-type DNA-binding protein n=1 Tax=Nitzschia inconspicua TaxID=303405 RepID=A0A9K3KPM1_9STRA|nr:HSF-type DNA-binding protein [Nitzschia inconspicua]
MEVRNPESAASPRSVVSDIDRSTDGSSGSSVSDTTSESEHQEQQPGNPAVLFPWKLHEMLLNAITEHKESIVSWLPEGKAFKVHNVPEFVRDILPMYFKQTKYKSFQRQLNLWNFERLTSGPHKGAYFHPQFVKDRPDWCKLLTRQRAKKVSRDGGNSPSSSLATAPPSTAAAQSAVKTSRASATSRPTMRRPVVVPLQGSADGASAIMPRQVSESSLESFGELLREFDTAATSIDTTLDLAEFEGFTFHLLEQERYEELNLEFKFQESSNNLHAQHQTSMLPEEEPSNVQILLQELEQGTFGTPKTSFDILGPGENCLPVHAA